jgi:hypothetical protein
LDSIDSPALLKERADRGFVLDPGDGRRSGVVAILARIELQEIEDLLFQFFVFPLIASVVVCHRDRSLGSENGESVDEDAFFGGIGFHSDACDVAEEDCSSRDFE